MLGGPRVYGGHGVTTMLEIKKIDHVGIRVRQRDRAVEFYSALGFEVMSEGIFEKGHPIIMEHACGVVLNVLGPATGADGPNVLMDVEDDKPAGYTHMALRVASLADARTVLAERGISITEELAFGDLRAVFFRDPDGNVIELDDYPGAEPQTRAGGPKAGYEEHP